MTLSDLNARVTGGSGGGGGSGTRGGSGGGASGGSGSDVGSTGGSGGDSGGVDGARKSVIVAVDDGVSNGGDLFADIRHQLPVAPAYLLHPAMLRTLAPQAQLAALTATVRALHMRCAAAQRTVRRARQQIDYQVGVITLSAGYYYWPLLLAHAIKHSLLYPFLPRLTR
jgi:hypothetical protein